MPWFTLPPVSDPAVFDNATHRHTLVMDLPVGADVVWAGLVADKPLAWCKALNGAYTSSRPFGVGTTREVTALHTIKLRERFFAWDDAAHHHSFYVEQCNLPVFKLFAEDYRVTPTSSGCRFEWRFAFEGNPKLGPMFGLTQRINNKVLLDGFARDTVRRFGGTYTTG